MVILGLFGRNLRLRGGALCGSRHWWGGGYEVIPADSIEVVREYGWNNPFLLVIAGKKQYTVNPVNRFHPDYGDIVRFLDRHGHMTK